MSSEIQIEQEWRRAIKDASIEARVLLKSVAAGHATSFADQFYAALLADPQSSAFISHSAVEERLHASFERWVRLLLADFDPSSIPEAIETQKHIGEVHARVNIRIELVLRASRVMKRAILNKLIETEPYSYTIRREASLLALEIIDFALEVMSSEYTVASESAARADQAYRSYAATVNMSFEREAQRSALFDWSNRLLQEVMMATGELSLARISQSSFGLWVRHKAHALFPKQSAMHEILNLMRTIDGDCLSEVESAQREGDELTLKRAMREVVRYTEQIRLALDLLFDEAIRVESGRDALTQLLSRRFLPSVLSREISLARETNIGFAVLLLDVDHFKSINDRYGHDVGDRVLQRIANQLTQSARSGDFVFRYGGEEFLIVCVELSAAAARSAAERFRREIEGLSIELEGQAPLKITASVGVAVYDGHPDYERLIKHADEALYEAKERGRNLVVVHQLSAPAPASSAG